MEKSGENVRPGNSFEKWNNVEIMCILILWLVEQWAGRILWIIIKSSFVGWIFSCTRFVCYKYLISAIQA